MIGRGDQTTGADLCILADFDGPMAEQATEAIDGRAVANSNTPLGSSSDIDGILEQAVVADAHIGRIDDFGPRPNNRSLPYTAFDVAILHRREADATQTQQLRRIGPDDTLEVGSLVQCVHKCSGLFHLPQSRSPGKSCPKSGKEHPPSRHKKSLLISPV